MSTNELAPHTVFTFTDADGDTIALTNLNDELIVECAGNGATSGVALGPVEALSLAGHLIGWVTGDVRPAFDVSVSDSEVQ